MSDHGRHSLRGYKVQTIVSLLEALQENPEWKIFSIEPKDEAKEVDVCFEKKDESKMLIQVKSTKNQFTSKNAHNWLQKLKSVYKGCGTNIEYKLVLVGATKETISADEIKIIPLNLDKMYEEVCSLLQLYFDKNSSSEPTDDALLTLANALCNIAEGDAIASRGYTRKSFVQLLEELNSTVVQVERLDFNTYSNLKEFCGGLELLVKSWNLKPQSHHPILVTEIDADYCDFKNLITTIESKIDKNTALFREINKIGQNVIYINGMLRQFKESVQEIMDSMYAKEKELYEIGEQDKRFKKWQTVDDYKQYIHSIEEFLKVVNQKYGMKLI
ncbi:TPA: hypothetical protein QCX64_004280, partial [Bacillus thuringiensis]|nr:hypothetical protein [Bacillus thuringiensis]